MRQYLWFLVASLLCATIAHADVNWIGGTSSDVFDDSNWDLSGSPGTVVDENVTIMDNVLVGPGPFDHNPEIPNLGGQVRLQLGDGFTLTVDGGSLQYISGGNDGVGGEPDSDGEISNDGINGPIVEVINGGQFSPFFVVNDVRVNVDGSSSVTFGGGGNPVNNSSINLQPGASLTFLAETPDQFNTEHLGKLLIDGAAAVQDVNFTLAAMGAGGSVINAIPEPASIVLLGLACLGLLSRRRCR